MNNQSLLKNKIVIILLFGILGMLCVYGGYQYGRSGSNIKALHEQTKRDGEASIWTCSMHPQIRKPNSGQCPLCGMDLIKEVKGSESKSGDMRTISFSQNAIKLMEVETVPVQRKKVSRQIRMIGMVEYDETRLTEITSWVSGRLDRLFVDYTGVTVSKNDHMVSIYSPELLSTQEELIQALNAYHDSSQESNYVKKSSLQTITAVREKLRLLGVTNDQIKLIEKTKKVKDHMTIYALNSGIVIKKYVNEGDYVKRGAKIYTIADLSKVWIFLNAYESDFQWLRYGQKVALSTIAYPGEIFTGTISFIDPIMTMKTRTIKVRVNVDNLDGKLKPGLFIKAIVHSDISAGGKVIDPQLSGKWICPMHPEIISNTKITCSICDMNLVTIESLGYVKKDINNQEMPLVIPISAALITGKRAVVYIKDQDQKRPTFIGREIVLGPKTRDYYIVRNGLLEGDEIVVNGNFKIDSALQIKAKPSMMSVKGITPLDHDNGGALNKLALSDLINNYKRLQVLLSEDNNIEAKKITNAFIEKNMALLKSNNLDALYKKIVQSNDLKNTRALFGALSNKMIKLLALDTSNIEVDLFIMHCSMAFSNSGANWIQDNETILNPYFGSKMLHCGSVTGKINQ